ncbi:MAG: hypothetical protein N3D11_15340 [Candidatus Sumerlaeia bacterium]|nr:hypothetical protein [Candidatus Sumerlaeia bacterium]
MVFLNEQPKNRGESWRTLALLSLFILVVAAADSLMVLTVHDTFLPPVRPGEVAVSDTADWSAQQCYPRSWKTVAAGWAGRFFSDTTVTVLVVVFCHALLWAGVYHAGRAIFPVSPWSALLGVLLVRMAPDLFGVDLLSAKEPSRLAAIALCFWSVGLTVRRRWVEACCVAGLTAHLLPTVACWFGQFIVVALVCLNYEWGWKKSLAGAGCFFLISVRPLTQFFLSEILPDPPIAAEAMMGLHFFSDPALSPFFPPLWAYVCLTVYLAMSFVWLKSHYDRRTIPVVIIFYLIGMAGLLLEVFFVGLVPVERAVRFELSHQRAFWFLWIAVFYSPELAGQIQRAWTSGGLWRPLLRGLLFSMQVGWSALTLVERWFTAPRWNRAVVAAMLALLVLTVWILPQREGPVVSFAGLAVAAVLPFLAVAAGASRRATFPSKLPAHVLAATGLFAFAILGFHGDSLRHHLADLRRNAALRADWQEVWGWAAAHSPADSTWLVNWQPRRFRRATGRAIGVNRSEVPASPADRWEWFQRYCDVYGRPLPTQARSPYPVPPCGQEREEPQEMIRYLEGLRTSFLLGAKHWLSVFEERPVGSFFSAAQYDIDYVVVARLDLPATLPEAESNVGVVVQSAGRFGKLEILYVTGRPDTARP